MNAPALGFIGFGEAAFWLARGLREQGVTKVVAYDLHTSTPKRGELGDRGGADAGALAGKPALPTHSVIGSAL